MKSEVQRLQHSLEQHKLALQQLSKGGWIAVIVRYVWKCSLMV